MAGTTAVAVDADVVITTDAVEEIPSVKASARDTGRATMMHCGTAAAAAVDAVVVVMAAVAAVLAAVAAAVVVAVVGGGNVAMGKPIFRSSLSMTKATRAIYPLSSSNDRKKNKSTIMGKKDSTLPTPAQTPSTNSDCSHSLTCA